MAVRQGWFLLSSSQPPCHPALPLSTLSTSLQSTDVLRDLLEEAARPPGARLPFAGELRRVPPGGSHPSRVSADHREHGGSPGAPLPADPRGTKAQGTHP